MEHPLVPTPAVRRQTRALAYAARDTRRDRHAIRCLRRIPWAAVLSLSLSLGAAPGPARADSSEQMQGLDEQVQEIKSEVLGIAAELSRLEERLLYPSNTQVAVFVSLSGGEGLRLDSAQIQIDGQPVARHIYSFKELEALQKGGVQRIYTGNLATGEHLLEVSFSGKLGNGGDFSANEAFRFTKQVEPKLVGVTLAAPESGAAQILLGGW